MGDFGPIAVAVITTAGAILATWLAARRLGRLGLGDTQLQVNASLRELAETEKSKAAIWQGRYEDELAAHKADQELAKSDKAAIVGDLRSTQRALDDCDRQKDEVRSELRALVRSQRSDAAPPSARPIRRRQRDGSPGDD